MPNTKKTSEMCNGATDYLYAESESTAKSATVVTTDNTYRSCSHRTHHGIPLHIMSVYQ